MVDLTYCLTRWLFFDIPLLYYYITLINNFLSFSGDIYLFCISVSLSTVSQVFCGVFFGNFFRNFLTNQISSHSCCFYNCPFWRFFKCICGWLFSMIKNFWLHLLFKFFLILPYIMLNIIFPYIIFTNVFTHTFSKKQKFVTFYKYLILWVNWIASHFYILRFN